MSEFKINDRDQVIENGWLEYLPANSPSLAKLPALKDFAGLGHAKVEAENLIRDIKDAMSGKLEWSLVNRGMLMEGPPGTGKTTLAKIIARECGVPFFFADVATLSGLEPEQISKVFKYLHNCSKEYSTFCFLFLDEIDSLPNLSKSGQNLSYYAPKVNAFKTGLAGAGDNAGLVVVAATNDPENVDPALRRPGRLDKTITINYPDKKDFFEILNFQLKQKQIRVKQDVLKGFVEYLYQPDISSRFRPLEGLDKYLDEEKGCTLPLAAGDVELMARELHRLVRYKRIAHSKIGRETLIEALEKAKYVTLAESKHSPSVVEDMGWRFEQYTSDREYSRTAVHEAGHAVIAAMAPKELRLAPAKVILNKNIVGFPVTSFGRGEVGAETIRWRLRIALAGVAAEECVYGEPGVGGGGDLPDALEFAAILSTLISKSDVSNSGVTSEAHFGLYYLQSKDKGGLSSLFAQFPDLHKTVTSLVAKEYEIVRKLIDAINKAPSDGNKGCGYDITLEPFTNKQVRDKNTKLPPFHQVVFLLAKSGELDGWMVEHLVLPHAKPGGDYGYAVRVPDAFQR